MSITIDGSANTIVGSGVYTLTSPTLVTPALGTPASGTLDNCTSNTETAANNSTQLATTAYADRLTGGTLAGVFTTLRATTGAAVGGATAGTGGIAFPATQVAVADANTLDDYEEGTWTPVLGGAGGQSGQTYSTQSGSYTKVGNLVTCSFQATLTNAGTITGAHQIKGLPIGSSSSLPQGCVNISVYVNLGISVYTLNARVEGASTNCLPTYSTVAGASAESGSTSLFTNTTQLNGTIQYFV